MNTTKLFAVARPWLLLLCVAAALPVHAQQDVIDARQEGFKAMGGAMKALRDELKSGGNNVAIMRDSAQNMAMYAAKVPQWFPAGSGPESGLATDALGYIWKNTDKFNTLTQALITEANSLVAIVAEADAAAIKQQLLAVKDSCSACHKSFRAD